MTSRILTFLVAFVACVLLLPVVRHFAHRFVLYDRTGELKIHVGPIPRIGGLAIAIAFLIALVVGGQLQSKGMMYFLGALTLLWVVCFIDDIRDLPPYVRFLAQAISASLLYWGGWQAVISRFTIINFVVTILLVMWFVIAFNFVDGCDGMAAGLASVAAFALVGSFAIQHASGLMAVAAALSGCCLGFLLFNYPPASIFMGDCGSTMLGLVLGWLALASVHDHPGANLGLAPPFVFSSLPLADAAFAIVRRVRGGKSPFAGDRSHFFDLLLQRGWSPRRVALVSYAAAAVFAFLGLLGQFAFLNGEVTVVASVMIVVLGLRLGSLTPESQLVPN